MQAKLIPADGGEPVHVTKDVTLVGRKPGLCDMVIKQNSVSKIHCLLVKTDGLLFVRDLSSTNGTRVNGQRVTRGALLPGDELSFGGVKFRVYLGPGESPAGHGDETEAMGSFPSMPKEEDRFDDSGSDSDVRLLKDE